LYARTAPLRLTGVAADRGPPFRFPGGMLVLQMGRSAAVAPMNTIANLKALNLQSAEGPVAAIVIGLNIPDVQGADSFIQEVAEKFKLQRMCSPPTTSVLLITVVTELPAARFVERWHELEAQDKILEFFMSQMRKADVVRGTVLGETLENISLLGGAAGPRP
jgi:hypothetical protein